MYSCSLISGGILGELCGDGYTHCLLMGTHHDDIPHDSATHESVTTTEVESELVSAVLVVVLLSVVCPCATDRQSAAKTRANKRDGMHLLNPMSPAPSHAASRSRVENEKRRKSTATGRCKLEYDYASLQNFSRCFSLVRNVERFSLIPEIVQGR